jgi:hypothetical protein
MPQGAQGVTQDQGETAVDAISAFMLEFSVVAARIDAHEAVYLRRRALMDGPDADGATYIDRVAAELSLFTAERAEQFEHWALGNLRKLRRVTLNACALVALRAGRWSVAASLAREVTARDHHDLMAQRIVDAAAEQAADLRTETDRWLEDRICRAPFRQIETRADRSVHFCCSAWQPVPIGKIEDKAAGSEDAGFWDSVQAREIRRSVTEGDFSHCSRWHCPAIANRRLPRRPDLPAIAAIPDQPADPRPDQTWPDPGKGPKRIILSHDRSCNISCPSCRTKVILADHASSRELDRMFQVSLLPYLEDAEDIKVTGSGDPFGSRHFRQVLTMLCAQGKPRRRIQLHTNGLLANERAWNELGLWDNVSSVWVSVDAARAETYAVLRRGGEFGQLIENLHFLGGLCRDGRIDSLRLDFVVQQTNYEEIGAFVDLADRVGAGGVYFLRLRNWGHFTAEEFRQLDVCDPTHPEHGRLLQQLADPRLAGPAVDLGSMASLRGVRPQM